MNETNIISKIFGQNNLKLININSISKEELYILIKEFNLMDKLITENMKNNCMLNIGLLDSSNMIKVLKEYVNSNLDEVKTLQKELELLNIVNKTPLNREELLNKINNIELKYKIFYIFTNNIVKKEELEKLYNIKFEILVININKLRIPIVNKNTNNIELECYKQIVKEKIKKILKNNNEEVRKIFSQQEGKVSHILFNIFRNKDIRINIKELLYHPDPIILALLLSFDNENGFYKFLDEYKIKKMDLYFVNFRNGMFKWQDELCINTVLDIIENDDIPEILFEQLLELKKILPKMGESEFYKLPEGLEEIYEFDSFYCKDDEFFKRLKNKMLDKIIITPESLKRVSWLAFRDIKVREINYNEGLTYIDYIFDSEYGLTTKTLTLPSSLEKTKDEIRANMLGLWYIPHINLYEMSFCPEVLKINNYENSVLLNDRYKLEILISRLFYKISNHSLSAQLAFNMRTKEKLKQFGAFSHDIEPYRYTYESVICSFLKKIILISKDAKQEIEIDCDMLKETKTEEYFFRFNKTSYSNLKIDEVNLIISKLKELIYFKTGYKILEKFDKENKTLKKTRFH